jgi:hypothetical protein
VAIVLGLLVQVHPGQRGPWLHYYIVIAFVLRFALKQTCADCCSGPTTFFGPSIFNASTGTTVALEVTDALLVRFLSCCFLAVHTAHGR